MDNVLRLLLRFIVVPLGYLAAVLAGTLVIVLGSWKLGAMAVSDHPDAASYAVFGFVVAGPILAIVLLSIMWLPASIGVLISEAFAIRSWIFHAANGAISAWLGWQMFAIFSKPGEAAWNEPHYIVAAGLAGGLAYWAVAGWNAGFYKPVFASAAPPPAAPTPLPPPSAPDSPFVTTNIQPASLPPPTPPARTEA